MTPEKKSEETTQFYKKPRHGEFCWMELASTNIAACKPFYAELCGWDISQSSSVPGIDYTEFGTNEKTRSGGMFQMGEEFGKMPSHWMLYVAVDDVDAAAKKVESLGGRICVPPSDIPNTGRFCVINDPSGATISLITLNA